MAVLLRNRGDTDIPQTIAMQQAILAAVGLTLSLGKVLGLSAGSLVAVGQLAVPSTLGDVIFLVPANYTSTVTEVEGRIRAEGSSTVLATKRVAAPASYDGTHAKINMLTEFNARSAGNYRVSVAMINASGTTDSAESNIAYTVPLQA
jgi:hypothetical protein